MYEDEDIMVLTIQGDISPQELTQIFATADGLTARYGQYGALIDAEGLGSMSASSRRVAASWKGAKSCYGNAIFGAGMAARVLFTLVARAIQLVTSNQFRAAFFKTEAEARRWLRARHDAEKHAALQ